eukprot:1140902-Pelagomonas_calceolata.AAC.7
MSSAFAGVWDTHNNPTPSKAGVCGAWSARALAFQTRTSAAASFMSTMSNGSAITAGSACAFPGAQGKPVTCTFQPLLCRLAGSGAHGAA